MNGRGGVRPGAYLKLANFGPVAAGPARYFRHIRHLPECGLNFPRQVV